MRRRPFTLLELLMVVAIILILVSLMAPAWGKLREKSKRLVCQSNQMQVVRAMHVYGFANRGFLPDNNGVSIYTSFDLTESSWAKVEKTPAGLGLLLAAGYVPQGKFFHCPSLNTKAASGAPGHCMDLKESNYWNGVGASYYNDPNFKTARKITGYNYRWPSYKIQKGLALRTSMDNLVLLGDILDPRFSSAIYGHRNGYNRVLLDGSATFYKDEAKVIYTIAAAAGNIDGVTSSATDEQIYTKLAQ